MLSRSSFFFRSCSSSSSLSFVGCCSSAKFCGSKTSYSFFAAFSPLLMSSKSFASSGPTAAAGAASAPTTIEQQSEQAEYNEILAAANLQQQQAAAAAAAADAPPAGHAAKLLSFAHPSLFDELCTIHSSPERHRLCKKHLLIDSPEIFAWKCSDCNQTYEKSVVERALFDANCPHCAQAERPRLIKDSRPDLLAEVASELLNDPFLDVEGLPCESKARVWWTCSSCGCDFQARVTDRVRGKKGCPRCNVQASAFVAEKLRKEWHPTKNGDLDPAAMVQLSEKKQLVWWLCSTCTHEWQARVNTRFSGSGSCPGCFGSTSATTTEAPAADPSALTSSQQTALRSKLRKQRDLENEKSRVLLHKKNTVAHEKMNDALKRASSSFFQPSHHSTEQQQQYAPAPKSKLVVTSKAPVATELKRASLEKEAKLAMAQEQAERKQRAATHPAVAPSKLKQAAGGKTSSNTLEAQFKRGLRSKRKVK